MKISQQGLRSLLEGFETQAPIEVDYQSEVKLKKGNPFGKAIVKIAHYRGVINKSHHQAEVDAVRERGTGHLVDVPQARKWGVRVGHSPIIVHGDNGYVAATEVDEVSVSYRDEGGNPIATEDVTPWLYAKSEIVSTRDFNLAKITRAKIGDDEYELS